MLLFCIELGVSYKSIRVKPSNLIVNDEDLFVEAYSYNVPSYYVKKIKHADILVDTVYDKLNFTFFSSDTHINGYFTIKQKIKYLKHYFNKQVTLKNGVWITQNWTRMYFHWLTDALTRLIASEPYLENCVVILPEDYQIYPFVKESLDLLGYSIFWYDVKKRVSVTNLFMPTQTSSPGNYNDDLIKKLRSKFLYTQNTSNKYVYISRAKATQRFIKNEEELISLLVDFNVEVHIFEEYSFLEQIQIMNQSSVLIGLHGAGLTNMIFMHERAKILEIRNYGDRHNNCYFSLSSSLNHTYYYLQGKENSMDTHNALIELDLELVENLLIEMGLKNTFLE